MPADLLSDDLLHDDLLRYRSEFPILERTNYMISNSLGAMPRAVYDALHAYADIWATRAFAPGKSAGGCWLSKLAMNSAP